MRWQNRIPRCCRSGRRNRRTPSASEKRSWRITCRGWNRIDELTDPERNWIASQLAEARTFVDLFSPADAGRPLSLAALDRAFARWIASEPSDVDSINSTINAVGIAFGRFLVERVGLKWVIATDQVGTEVAVYGLPGTADVLVYPQNFVAKRWEQRETNFLEKSFGEIEREVGRLGVQSLRRPWWKFW